MRRWRFACARGCWVECRNELRARPRRSLLGTIPSHDLTAYDVRERVKEVGCCIWRLGPEKILETGGQRLLATGHVHVVQRLQMVGQELDGRDHHLAMAARGQLRQDLQQVRLEPFLWGVASALVSEGPLAGRKL